MQVEKFLGALSSYITADQIELASDGKLGLFGATSVVQQSGSRQVAITESPGGTVSDTMATGIGAYAITIPVPYMTALVAADFLTAYTPGHRFEVLGVSFAVSLPPSTASKLCDVNLELGTTNVTGGVVSLTTANCSAFGGVVNGTAITANAVGSASDTLSIEVTNVTAFIEGAGYFLIRLKNLDAADAAATIADKWNEIRGALVTYGLLAGG